MEMGKNRHGRGHALIALVLTALILMGSSACNPPAVESSKKTMYEVKRDFIDLRWGMFICYNIMSYGARWSQPDFPVDSFRAPLLDCNQWAEAAKSAGMTFGLLTTKHHEGFCLWDSEYTDYDVAGAGYDRDIVAEYIEAFREKGMKIGLYFSIRDTHHNIEKGMMDEKGVAFVKGQIRELLDGRYGKVDYFVTDGWFWNMGYNDVDWFEIRELIRELQPECLLTDHTHLAAPYRMEIPYFEGPFGAYPPEGNTMASALGHCSVLGNGWFWDHRTPAGMKKNDGVDVVLQKLKECEARYCNFMLNCMPNRDGLLDTIYLDMLRELGQRWSPDPDRPPLPDPGKEVVVPVRLENVEVSSGADSLLLDGTKIPGGAHYTWYSDSILPQRILMDLGEILEVDVLSIVHDQRVKPAPEAPLEEGNVLKAVLYAGSDPADMKEVARVQWDGPAPYRNIPFELREARYLKLEILERIGPNVRIVALDPGRSFLP